jgi:hypothetical protein
VNPFVESEVDQTINEFDSESTTEVGDDVDLTIVNFTVESKKLFPDSSQVVEEPYRMIGENGVRSKKSLDSSEVVEEVEDMIVDASKKQVSDSTDVQSKNPSSDSIGLSEDGEGGPTIAAQSEKRSPDSSDLTDLSKDDLTDVQLKNPSSDSIGLSEDDEGGPTIAAQSEKCSPDSSDLTDLSKVDEGDPTVGMVVIKPSSNLTDSTKDGEDDLMIGVNSTDSAKDDEDDPMIGFKPKKPSSNSEKEDDDDPMIGIKLKKALSDSTYSPDDDEGDDHDEGDTMVGVKLKKSSSDSTDSSDDDEVDAMIGVESKKPSLDSNHSSKDDEGEPVAGFDSMNLSDSPKADGVPGVSVEEANKIIGFEPRRSSRNAAAKNNLSPMIIAAPKPSFGKRKRKDGNSLQVNASNNPILRKLMTTI